MKSGTRLDSAVFQLTPTRTRCDLVITANGKTDKIASGLLSPFLSHLKTAQDQMAKGGYSIMLKPDPGRDSVWFTKGTMERFVRFVSTPEVLERVATIESEILQIEEAISIQSNDNLGTSTQVDVLHKKVEDHKTKPLESIEGSKTVSDNDADKAIVLYKPGEAPPESNGSATLEENSKVQLLRVLEARRSSLQKEQGMAFARAAAAGFDMDPMGHLISFAECFGASRLMEACLRFMNLWKEKHESGQWLEVEAAEVMSSRLDFSSMNAFGSMPFIETTKQKELQEAWQESNGETHNENNGKASNDASADKSPPLPPDQLEYFQGQFQHPMFPQWPPGAPPVFQPYPMQGMPYYPNYPGSGPFFQPPYPPMENPKFNTAQRMGLRRHSMDSKESNTELESWDLGVPNNRSQEGSELEKENSDHRDSRRKTGRSGKNQSGMVVIRNINYITSKRQNASCSDSGSDPETDEEMEDLQDDASKKQKNPIRSSRREGSRSKSNTPDLHEKDDIIPEQEAEFGNWQAFQNCLLRDDGDNQTAARSLFSMEKESQVIRKRSSTGPDPILPHGRESREVHDGRMSGFNTHSEKVAHTRKASSDELVVPGREFGGGSRESKADVLSTEIESGRGGYRRVSNDDFMIYGQDNKLGIASSQAEPLSGDIIERVSDNVHRNSSHNVTDESYIIPLRSSSQNRIGTGDQTAIDMDSEFQSGPQKTVDSFTRIKSQLSYEPDDLSLMPERGAERESVGYDPAVDYEMQEHTENSGMSQRRNKEDAMIDTKELSKKLNKDKKSKGMQESLEKRKMEATRRIAKPSKLGPSNEAQARAERLRAFKADLQKIKKEKEEEDLKRLEALKRERQKRIAARGSSSSAQLPVLPQSKPQLPMKLSPGSQKGSKFSDSEPGSSSPLRRFPVRTASVGSDDTQKLIKPSRLKSGSHLTGNGLSRSVSSLPELKKEKGSITPEAKISSARIRRLSEPKMSTNVHVSSVKAQKSDSVPKSKASNGSEITKISAIVRLDKTKTATLPELKIRTTKGSSDMVHNRSGTKELTQKTNGSRSSGTSENAKPKNDEKSFDDSNRDGNLIIDKNVVMLESQIPQIPVIQESEERMEIRKFSSDKHKVGEKSELISDNVTIHTSASLHGLPEIVQDLGTCQLNGGSNSHEVVTYCAREESSKFSSTNIVENSPYQAPYARTTSLEDPCTTNSEYTKAPPTNSMAATNVETAKAYVSDFTDLNSLEPIPESTEKPRGKESAKGFRRLLKFGRKNSSSLANEQDVESDKLSINGSQDYINATSSASYEVHTLKNLISQDETPTASTPQKVSRPFSLLSPFRSKTSEKKIT